MKIHLIALASLLAGAHGAALAADPDARATATEARMTDDERFQLLHSQITFPISAVAKGVDGVKQASGYVPGIVRLGLPPLIATDASLGVADPVGLRKGDISTALPSGLALAASFNPEITYAGGAMIGAEARAKGFNLLLGGGVNLARDPRNGRNFEYLGEDPLLAGILAGEAIRGTQSQNVISTIKHYALNDQETLRHWTDARIDEAAHRESDLLAFQIAIERGQPGSVMCSYNLVNGVYACGNDHLLNKVLKQDWGYKGWVMSDWGAAHDVSYFNAGLDQQSGAQLDKQVWFDQPLRAELAAAKVSRSRLSDAVRRILRSMYAIGADRPLAESPIDYAAHAKLARRAASEGIVLLKNDGVLPLAEAVRSIAVIGGYAQTGVMSGGGSSQVIPAGEPAYIPVGGSGSFAPLLRQLIMPSSPQKALQDALPKADVTYDSGYFPETAAAHAARADVAIVFATQWQSEMVDAGGLSLPQGQDALIAAVAKVNPNTIVVLETGNPVRMPWLQDVKAVVEAWYPGQEGGPAIADVLTGAVNPSGRLPISFPMDEAQLPHPQIPGLGAPDETRISIDYTEGADVGYRWFAAMGLKPLFPFGHGLSYTRFEYDTLKLDSGKTLTARVTVRNRGTRAGAAVPQLYLTNAAGKAVQRLTGFAKVVLQPGESKTVAIDIDPRLMAHWDGKGWRIDAGSYELALGASSADLRQTAKVRLVERTLYP